MHSARPIPLVCLLLVACLAACDGSGRACELARIQINKGDLVRAEALLADAHGAEAESVRVQIERRRRNRERIHARIAELEAQLETASAGAVREELSGLLLHEPDPGARLVLEQALSDLADAFAARARPGLGLAVLGEAGSRPAGTVESGEGGDQLRALGRLRQDVGVAIDVRAWDRAWPMLARLAHYPELDAAELEALRAELLEGASREAERLLAGAATLAAGGDARDALVFLERHQARFPEDPALAFFHDGLAAYAEHGPADSGEAVEARDSGASQLTDEQRAAFVDRFLDLDGEGRAAVWPAVLNLRDEQVTQAALVGCVEHAGAILLANPVLEQLLELSELRAELDLQRADALAAIFDEQEYFYPYDPPEPPRERTDYVRAQRLVDQLVDALRATWNQGLTVELPAEFATALADLEWALDRALERSGLQALEIALPAALPEYVLALPFELERVTIQDFAWTPTEARQLGLARQIRELNTRAFEEARAGGPGSDPASVPDADEREMVRLVNDYRLMFGLSCLAWNARLQAASAGHSEYMRRYAVMGHIEEDPARRTVADRLALVGYQGVAAENCVLHEQGPVPALIWWVHSSGHHRNLLLEAHREIGVACDEDWWTQELGGGLEYLEALKR